MGRIRRYIWFLLMIIIGAGIGLYYSWFVKPPDFVDAVFPNLRLDYKTDYVLMVAEIYDQDHNRLEAVHRLDDLLYQNEVREDVIESVIRNARQLGYDPVDLHKMENLYKAVTGQNATPTPTIDPTKDFSGQMTATAVAVILQSNSDDTTVSGTSEGGSDDSGVPQADQDPFGTGVRATTDPNAMPELDLPSAPTITPNPGLSWDDEADPGPSPDTGSSDSADDGFGGVPDSFFDRR